MSEQRIERIEDSDGWRWYRHEGKKYASVTNVLDCVTPKQLQKWWKEKGPAEIKKKTTKARNLGTEDHAALEQYIKKGEIKPGSESFIDAWSGFAVSEGIVPAESEVMVWSDTLGVAGTVDLICDIKNTSTVADLKTGRSLGIKTGWQLAGYKYCIEEMRDTSGMRMAGIHSKRIVDPVINEPHYEMKVFHYEHMQFCLQRFLCALECWRGMYYHKLKKMEWSFLDNYTANLTFKESDDKGEKVREENDK